MHIFRPARQDASNIRDPAKFLMRGLQRLLDFASPNVLTGFLERNPRDDSSEYHVVPESDDVPTSAPVHDDGARGPESRRSFSGGFVEK